VNYQNDLVCPTCGSVDKDNNTITMNGKEYHCPCKEQKEKALLYRAERANIPKEYWHLDMEDFKGDKKSLKEINEYIQYIDNYYKKGIGLLLWGTHGTGKTFCTIHVLKEAIKKHYRNVRFTCLSDIVSLFTASWYNDNEKKEFYNKMMETQFLVIDDVGKEYKTKSNLSESVFDRVLRYREHPTIITSNRALEDIENTYGESIASLMYGKLISIRFSGEDFRKVEISKQLKDIGKQPMGLELII